MADPDPFSDTAFMGRLQKLLPMLGSEQPGEAEAARRKLREHLGTHRLTFLDLSLRLGTAASRATRESLERQLTIARAAKDDAAREANAASARLRNLEAELQQATFDRADVLRRQDRFRKLALAGWCAAIGIAAVTYGPKLAKSPLVSLASRGRDTGTIDMNGPADAQMSDPTQNGANLHLQGGERPGSAAVQDLPIRLAPNDDATVRAFLNKGEHLAIQQELRRNSQTWLLVRTGTGTGWVRSGDVMH